MWLVEWAKYDEPSLPEAVMRLKGIEVAAQMPVTSSEPGSQSLTWKSRNKFKPNEDLEPILTTVAPNEMACD